MELRRFCARDLPACRALIHRAVHEGAAAHYTARQRAAWAPPAPATPEAEARFAARLAAQIAWVAEDAGGLAGFFSLRRDGYLDFAYVAPEHMGTGLAGQLYDRILAEARTRHLATLTTEASHLARPFLARRGWRVDAEQNVMRAGVGVTNFRMSLRLEAAEGRRGPL